MTKRSGRITKRQAGTLMHQMNLRPYWGIDYNPVLYSDGAQHWMKVYVGVDHAMTERERSILFEAADVFVREAILAAGFKPVRRGTWEFVYATD